MKLLSLVSLILALVASVRSQHGFDLGQYNGGGGALSARDPRANTGPILFPPPPGDNGQTSGVVVGASGYGFVPPNRGAPHPAQ